MERPAITVMIQAKIPERVFELVEKGIEGGADAFGIQIDQLRREYHNSETYKAIFDKMKGYPCYITNYRNNENEGLSDEKITEELLEIADCGGEIFDVIGDSFAPSSDQITYSEKAIENQKKLIDALHKKGKRVLVSSHTYRYLPYDEVYKIAKAQKERGADIAKIVTAAENEGELYSNFEITSRLKSELGLDFLFLCIGASCAPHRRIAPLISGGMFLCVAEKDEFSTPAQPLLCDAVNIVSSVFGKNL